MAKRAVPGLPEKVFPAIVSTGAGFREIPGASRESMTGMWPQKIRSRRDKNMSGKVRERLDTDARKPLRGNDMLAKLARGNGGPENWLQVIEIPDLPASRAVLSSYGGEKDRDEPSLLHPGGETRGRKGWRKSEGRKTP